MAYNLHIYGEEFFWKLAFTPGEVSRPTNLKVILYDDSTDSLTETSDIGDVGTEPTDGNYQRQDIPFDVNTFTVIEENADAVADMVDVIFDVINTTGDVDSWAVLGTFQSDRAGDSSANQHILFSGGLDQSYPLSKSDELTVENGGISLD